METLKRVSYRIAIGIACVVLVFGGARLRAQDAQGSDAVNAPTPAASSTSSDATSTQGGGSAAASSSSMLLP